MEGSEAVLFLTEGWIYIRNECYSDFINNETETNNETKDVTLKKCYGILLHFTGSSLLESGLLFKISFSDFRIYDNTHKP